MLTIFTLTGAIVGIALSIYAVAGVACVVSVLAKLLQLNVVRGQGGGGHQKCPKAPNDDCTRTHIASFKTIHDTALSKGISTHTCDYTKNNNRVALFLQHAICQMNSGTASTKQQSFLSVASTHPQRFQGLQP